MPSRKYRDDINGLRALAVIVVILFHFGVLPKGFLGVDVFFVISGFLITGIIYKELVEGRFSIINFYLRRTRRIIPLALFISFIALIVGIFTMLPDDLENLAQSVIATSFFSNNILQAITTKNYWDVINEYKPLMHTWSLGVEEQFYFLYPFVLLLLGKKGIKWILPVLSVAALASLSLYFLPYSDFQKFYLIFFRFWEIAAGGILAVALKNRLIVHKVSVLFVVGLFVLLCFDLPFLSVQAALILTVLFTLGILATANEKNVLSSIILENRLMVIAGKISFSLYMWHQLLLAYVRYFWAQELHISHLIVVAVLTTLLSLVTYYLIEQPFCNKNRVSTRTLFVTLGLLFILTNGSSFYIFTHAGVLKDLPELGIAKENAERGIHSKYNGRNRAYDKNFESTDKTKVLVIGNSFARDWINVLLESKFSDRLEIAYIAEPDQNADLELRANQADVIFYSTPKINFPQQLGIPESKLWAIGTKNFGTSNGIFYNYRGEGYYQQRTAMEKGYLEKNEELLEGWGGRYIDYIAKVIDANQRVPVFTPTHQFISQDCRHFTKAGAIYFAKLLEKDLEMMLRQSMSQ